MSKKTFFMGTFILAAAGILSRFIGFFYRIFLTHSLGAVGLGIFQLTMPVQTLLTAISAGGIQTAISRLCAYAMAHKKTEQAKDYFFIGTFFSGTIALSLSLLLYHHSSFVANILLKEPHTQPLIQILSFSLPLCTLHQCINSYYFSMKKTGLPSLLQLTEQCTRVLATYILYSFLLSRNQSATPVIACIGSLVSECVTAAVGGLSLFLHFQKEKILFKKICHCRAKLKALFSLAFPLTLNRILITLLGSIEVILIPQRLTMSGMTASQSLSAYGILSGMALPLILFPSTVTNSFAVMLMPSVTELKALQKKKQLQNVIFSSFRSIGILGSIFMLFFILFGHTAAAILFHNATAGIYIRILAFACPFLYLNTTLTSILHGFGKMGICLFYNSISTCIRIVSVLFLIPVYGLEGYLCSIILSEFIKTFLFSFSLYHVIREN